jgi:hypothetical protein
VDRARLIKQFKIFVVGRDTKSVVHGVESIGVSRRAQPKAAEQGDDQHGARNATARN